MSPQPAADIDLWEWNPKVTHKHSNALFSFLLNRDEHLQERKGRRLIADQSNQSWAWAAHPHAPKFAKRHHSDLTSMLARLTMLCHKQSARDAQAVPVYMQYPKTAEVMKEDADPAKANAFKIMDTMAEEEETDFYTGMKRSELVRLATDAKVREVLQQSIENNDAFDDQEETDFYTGMRFSQLAGAETKFNVEKVTQQKITNVDAIDDQVETDFYTGMKMSQLAGS